MRRTELLVLLAIPLVAASAFVAACGGDDDDGRGVTPAIDGGGSDASATGDSAVRSDAGDAGKPDTAPPEALTFTTYASFSAAAGQLPEGVVVIDGKPIVGYAPLGQLWNVLPDGGTTLFGQFTSPSNTFTLGMTVNAQKDVFVAVGATGSSPTPTPGVHKFVANGAPGRYSTSGAAMGFAKGLDIVGTEMFVSDSQGKIFKVSQTGVSSVWKENDPSLAGSLTACMSPGSFPIGVSGISHDDDYLYGVNFDKGTFFRIKRNADGSPGAVEKLFENCDFFGADGIARDADGSFIVANKVKNRIDRVTLGLLGSANATYRTIASGAPLDGPASVFIEGVVPNKRLWVTSSASSSAATDGGAPKPSLVIAPLAK